MSYVLLFVAATIIGAVLDATFPGFIDSLLGDRK